MGLNPIEANQVSSGSWNHQNKMEEGHAAGDTFLSEAYRPIHSFKIPPWKCLMGAGNNVCWEDRRKLLL